VPVPEIHTKQDALFPGNRGIEASGGWLMYLWFDWAKCYNVFI